MTSGTADGPEPGYAKLDGADRIHDSALCAIPDGRVQMINAFISRVVLDALVKRPKVKIFRMLRGPRLSVCCRIALQTQGPSIGGYVSLSLAQRC